MQENWSQSYWLWAKLPDEAGNAKEIALSASANDKDSYQITNWCLDSEATSYMTADGGTFLSLKMISKILELANNFRSSIDGVGDIQITVPDGGNGKWATLTQVIRVPDLRTKLMSVSNHHLNRGIRLHFKKTLLMWKTKTRNSGNSSWERWSVLPPRRFRKSVHRGKVQKFKANDLAWTSWSFERNELETVVWNGSRNRHEAFEDWTAWHLWNLY